MTARSVARQSGRGPIATDDQLDIVLVLVIGALLCGGLVMLTSASISLAERNTGNPFYYFEQADFCRRASGWPVRRSMLRVPSFGSGSVADLFARLPGARDADWSRS